MAPGSYRVTQAELAVLTLLWKRGPATIRRITDELYPEGTSSDYGTVQKLLDRLESKGCVGRDRTAFAHVFRPLVARRDLVADELQEVASRLCEGSLTPLLIHLVENRGLDAKDRQALRSLLEKDDAEEEKR